MMRLWHSAHWLLALVLCQEYEWCWFLNSLADKPTTINHVFTVHKRSCGKVMFSHLSVILFTGGHAWWGGACMVGGTCVAGGVHGRGHAWQERRPLQRMVRILLEYFLVHFRVHQYHFERNAENPSKNSKQKLCAWTVRNYRLNDIPKAWLDSNTLNQEKLLPRAVSCRAFNGQLTESHPFWMKEQIPCISIKQYHNESACSHRMFSTFKYS